MEGNLTINVSPLNQTQESRGDAFIYPGCLLFGIVINFVALIILFSSSKPKNSKHVLLLRSMVANDLVSLIGMFTVSLLKILNKITYWRCVLVVLMRGVGLGSGCVAFVMALERWLALTRPFIYQQVVTHQLLTRTIYCLWVFAAIVTYLPFMNLGLWIENNNGTLNCARYREARDPKDVTYAWIFWFVGTGLCVCIVYFNTCVSLALARLGNTHTSKLIRRVSKTMINSVKPHYSTNEELAFARLMVVLCITFVACWMPDMVSVIWAQVQRENRSPFFKSYTKAANILKIFHFISDPFIYVIYQYVTKTNCKVSKRKTLPMLKKPTPPTSLSTDATTPTSVLLHQRSFSTSVQLGDITS